MEFAPNDGQIVTMPPAIPRRKIPPDFGIGVLATGVDTTAAGSGVRSATCGPVAAAEVVGFAGAGAWAVQAARSVAPVAVARRRRTSRRLTTPRCGVTAGGVCPIMVNLSSMRYG